MNALEYNGFLVEDAGPVQGENAYRLVGLLDRTGRTVRQNDEAVRLRLYVTLRSQGEEILVSVDETSRRSNYGASSGEEYSDKFLKSLDRMMAKQ